MSDDNDLDYKAPPAKLIEIDSTSATFSDDKSVLPGRPVTETSIASSSQKNQLVGQIIGGHYEILSVLGEGGISVVYKARHVILGTPAAIKFLLPGTELDASAIMRFQREAQTTAELTHPSIAGIREFGIYQAVPYLVLEFVKGRSLAEIIESDKKLEPQRALDLLQQTAEALAFAHKHKVVHRDIKPSNIMVYKTKNGKEAIKVIDFGIAKVLEGDEQRNLTKTGDVFGTPSYMSPEQCQGGKVDYRADVYSLGCVAYEMFGGAPPFKGKRPIEVIVKHLNAKHKKLKPIKGLSGLNKVLDAALAKDPEDRYESCDEFLLDLNRLAQKQQPVGKPLPIGKIKKKSLFLAMMRALTVILLCFLAFFIWFITAFKPATIESLSEAIAKDPTYAANYMERGRLYYRNGTYQNALTDTAKSLELQPQNNFWAHKIRAETFNALEDYKSGREEATKAIADAPEDHHGYLCRGTALYYLGLYDEAIKDLKKSIETNHEPDIASWGNNRSLSNFYLACCYNALHQHQQALDVINRAIEGLPDRSMPTDQDSYYIQLLAERAKAYVGLKRPDAAMADAQAAIDVDPADASAKQIMEYVTQAKQSK